VKGDIKGFTILYVIDTSPLKEQAGKTSGILATN